MTDDAPVIYQDVLGRQVAVAGQFKLLDADTYTFTVTGAFDSSRELVIDPSLTWNTSLKSIGSYATMCEGIASDGSGNVLITGHAEDGNAKTTPFVVKVTAAGTVAWQTWLGRARRGLRLRHRGDGSGNALVTGAAYSSDFGGHNNTYYGDGDAFVAKVSSGGCAPLVHLFGGSGDHQGLGIAVDSAGEAIVAGRTPARRISRPHRRLSKAEPRDAFTATGLGSTGRHLLGVPAAGGTGDDEGSAAATARQRLVRRAGYTPSRRLCRATNLPASHGESLRRQDLPQRCVLASVVYLDGSAYDEGFGMHARQLRQRLRGRKSDFHPVRRGQPGRRPQQQRRLRRELDSTGSVFSVTYMGAAYSHYATGIALRIMPEDVVIAVRRRSSSAGTTRRGRNAPFSTFSPPR